jgi:HPt (histidine-containing phosphotransfer) domain-containing protein
MIDWPQVSQLRHEVSAEDFDEVVDLFFEEVEEITVRLANADQTTNLREDLHFLKGSALNLGFSAFAELSQLGESLCAKVAAKQVNVPEILSIYLGSKIARGFNSPVQLYPRHDA